MSAQPHRSGGVSGAFEVVAMASSAGGITALSSVLGAWPSTLPVPVLVVQLLDPRHETVIADVLERRTALSVRAGLS